MHQSINDKVKVLYDVEGIENPIGGLKMLMRISDPKARIIQYCSEFFNCISCIGYSKFRSKSPKESIKLLMRKVYPINLKIEMQRTIDMNKSLRNDAKTFIANYRPKPFTARLTISKIQMIINNSNKISHPILTTNHHKTKNTTATTLFLVTTS